MCEISPDIFKAYDIRGVVGRTLTPPVVERLGRAIGSEARARGLAEIVVGRDGRLSSPELSAALVTGLRLAGVGVVDIGLVATPMAYFAAYHLGSHSAVMVTGSHNPPDYNGLKIVLGDETLAGDAIQGLRRRIETESYSDDEGGYREQDIAQAYLERIVAGVHLARPMKIAVDCGNGAAGVIAPRLFEALGCRVDPLHCRVDGHFPHHHPDPSQPDNLRDLIARLREGDAEIGLAFDGDGDRLGVVTKGGDIVYPDRLLMLFADDVLARHPGARVLYDVKSTRHLHQWIADRGGEPMLWKSGHSLMKARMRETGALLAGELSGHIFIAERWYGFDDGLYAAARLLEYLSGQTDFDATLNALPDSVNTPELLIPMPEGEARRLVATLQQHARIEGAERIITLDGLRVEFPDGFGLVRASNTTPMLVLRFEADDKAALARIKQAFRDMMAPFSSVAAAIP
ncbi:MAG TPA: phosphomannomutase/phosphoglucomutase [Thiobacillaceae bacterium]|nr:phosphomannomutase/phosphoglucomutase [Thiobacillaceae bacterium]